MARCEHKNMVAPGYAHHASEQSMKCARVGRARKRCCAMDANRLASQYAPDSCGAKCRHAVLD